MCLPAFATNWIPSIAAEVRIGLVTTFTVTARSQLHSKAVSGIHVLDLKGCRQQTGLRRYRHIEGLEDGIRGVRYRWRNAWKSIYPLVIIGLHFLFFTACYKKIEQ